MKNLPLLLSLLWFLMLFLLFGKSFLFIKDTDLASYAKFSKFFCFIEVSNFYVVIYTCMCFSSALFCFFVCLKSLSILLIR